MSNSKLDDINTSLPAIEKEELLNRIDHDSELLLDLSELFHSEVMVYLKRLKLSQEVSDTTEQQKVLHTLKGMALNISAKPLASFIEDIEHVHFQNQKTMPAVSTLEAIKLEVKRIQDELNRIQQSP